MMSVNLSDIVISNIKGSNYQFIISLISKNETTNLLQNADLNEKIRALSIKKIWFILKVYIKMERTVIKFDDIKIPKQKFH